MLPAHFLRVIRRVVGLFMWIGSLGGLAHPLGHIRVSFVQELFVGSFFRGNRSLGHSFVSCGSLFGSAFRAGFIRWIIVSYVVVRVSLVVSGIWASLPIYVGCLLGIRSRDLTGLLSFCTVESL